MKTKKTVWGMTVMERNNLWDSERGQIWMELVGKVTEGDVGGQI